MPIISDLRCANTATWHVFANFQGDGVSNRTEDCAQRPCCQELHVSSITQFRSKFMYCITVIAYCTGYYASRVYEEISLP